MNYRSYRHQLRDQYQSFLCKRLYFSKAVTLIALTILLGFVYELPIIALIAVAFICSNFAPFLANLYHTGNNKRYEVNLPKIVIDTDCKLKLITDHIVYNNRFSLYTSQVGYAINLLFEPIFAIVHYTLSGILSPVHMIVAAVNYHHEKCKSLYAPKQEVLERTLKRIKTKAAEDTNIFFNTTINKKFDKFTKVKKQEEAVSDAPKSKTPVP